MVRQLEFGIFDMNIHHKKLTTAAEVQKELDNIRAKINLLRVPNYNRFQNGFSHILLVAMLRATIAINGQRSYLPMYSRALSKREYLATKLTMIY